MLLICVELKYFYFFVFCFGGILFVSFATVLFSVCSVPIYPASPEARPPSFLGRPTVRPRSMTGGAPTPGPTLTIQTDNKHTLQ